MLQSVILTQLESPEVLNTLKILRQEGDFFSYENELEISYLFKFIDFAKTCHRHMSWTSEISLTRSAFFQDF